MRKPTPPASSDAMHNTLVGEVRKLLDQPGCLLCRGEAETVRRYRFWYVTEQYARPDTRREVRQAAGFCPGHAGESLAAAPASVLAVVYEDLLAGGSGWPAINPQRCKPHRPLRHQFTAGNTLGMPILGN